ncbi:DUF4384 domain-containing protein [uncultured Treponema sp.]|uniref:DUF4384 domain-containing protein n=1 Tax=uncultured Treponema sp. TaxID=162155 RepID=UPI00258418D3|nr:DUF4384 domain-containing protein [uncultured Treponema sp.]
MKKYFSFILVAVLSVSTFAQNSISDGIRRFDNVLFEKQIQRAETAIGFIYYSDSETCGSVVPWIKNEIKRAAARTMRIKIIDTSSLSSEEQIVATRGVSFGQMKKSSEQKKYIISGTYFPNAENLELFLDLKDSTGELVASEKIIIPMSELKSLNLTLFPKNSMQANQILKDFEDAKVASVVEKDVSSVKSGSCEKRNIPKPDYLITAAMLDSEDNLVNMLYPNDIVKFMISVERDSYIAILCIDANGDKNWLPVENNFIRAGEVRTFPDLKDTVFKVVDGVYGAEQILIYASTSEKGLPEQTSTGKYARNDIQKITRGIMAVKQSSAENYETSVFKITYTVME